MFTGIVEEIGQVHDIHQAGARTRLTIGGSVVLGGTRVGDSIAADGVCVTVARLSGANFTCDVMPETLRRSTLGHLRRGDAINLERAVAYGGRVGGHYVQGHIDGTGTIRAMHGDGPAIIVRISADQDVLRYVVEKGFIAVDGASLTVVEATATDFSVSLVYHTQQSITLPTRRVGDLVNIEVDIIGKYVERFVRSPQAAAGQPGGLTMADLERHGFSMASART